MAEAPENIDVIEHEEDAPSTTEGRPVRNKKPNPKYDDTEQQARDKKRQRDATYKSVQNAFIQVQPLMNEQDYGEVRRLLGELEKKIKILERVNNEYLKCSVTADARKKAETEMTRVSANLQVIEEFLEDSAEDDDGENDAIDETQMPDLTAVVKALKASNKRLMKTQMQTFNEIASTLKTSLMTPKQEIMKFNGDPQTYQKFWSSFDAATKGISDDHSKLNYLIQSCVGEAKEAIEDYIILDPDRGFEEAKKTLKKRYGRPHVIARSYIDGLVTGPAIKPGDPDSLSRLSLAMTKCQTTLEAIGYEADLHNSESLLKIVRRLPFNLRTKWADRADTLIEGGDEPNFNHLTSFIERQARVATNMFGKDLARPQEKPVVRPRRGHAYSTSTKPQEQSSKCGHCKSNHPMWRCDEFSKLPYEERRRVTRSNRLCDNCFAYGHMSRQCEKRSFCNVRGCSVRYKHSTLLHPPAPQANTSNSPHVALPSVETNPPTQPPTQYGNSYCSTSSKAVCLKVIPLRVIHNNRCTETLALLDNCSDVSLCSKELLQRMRINGSKDTIFLNTVSGDRVPTSSARANLNIESMDGTQQLHLDQVWAVENLHISKESMARQTDIDKMPHLQGISLPQSDAMQVEVLIGGDNPNVFWTLEERRGKQNDPVAVRTILGWTVTGPMNVWKQKREFTSNFIKLSLEENLNRMWQTDFNDVPSTKQAMSIEDQRALKMMNGSTRKRGNHYEVGLPWRCDPPRLENNRQMAMTRLHSLQRQFHRNPALKIRYTQEIQGYIDKGYAEEVHMNPHLAPNDTRWYLPHHAVIHPKKPDKVRVVFDCSASYKGRSLNQELLQGPDFMNDLAGVLMRFREHPVALSADIESMFHQVRVTPSDTDALRFLWWKNGDTSQQPTNYKMLVHLFGATSSPSVCCFALRKTAEDNTHLYSDETIKTVLRDFYMDDCLKSVETVREAIELQESLRSLLQRGGFRLTKWISNETEVLSSVPESERAPSVQSLTLDELPTERTLGVQWNIKSDMFEFTPHVKEKPSTKRGILSTVSSLYDPLGLVSPVTLTAKLILQQLCRQRIPWDEKIDEEIAQRWQEWLQTLPAIASISIPRCYRPPSFESARTELHHFSDASERGYGAVSYLRFINDSGQTHCSIVTGKSRLAPLKSISVPRLELSAAVVAVRLNTMLDAELTIKVNKTFFWTDSTAVLQYIRNTNKRFKTYVANRLSVIHEGSEVAQWRHVGTKQNPADFASRGLMPTDSNKIKIWHTGPDFLWMSNQHWPDQPASIPPLEDDEEVKREPSTFFTSERDDNTGISDLIERFSSWYSLQKAVAWLNRFKHYCMHKYLPNKPSPSTDPLSVKEIRNATDDIVKAVQRKTYAKDIDCIQRFPNKRTTGDLCKLDPVRIDGILRVGGRLQNAPIPVSQKHPIILPGKHHVTDLILRHHHTALGHSGSDIMLNSVRKQFWVTSGKYAARKIISKCTKCRRASAPSGEQFMAPLPTARVTPDKPPFSSTGVDYFGPIYVKQGRSRVKRYGCLFTCLATRAIHIEIAHSMTTDSFLGALQRFISRRGKPDVLHSDNGTNFTSANKELKQSLQALEQLKIYDNLRQKGIEWKFNPPAASHMGGIWERMIRTTRRIMSMLLGEQTVNDECLLTLLAEVERIINDRPLTTPSSDATDPQPLSPNDLLLLRPNVSIPNGVYDKLSCYTRRWYHQAQYLASVFWKRWLREYLPTLQERQKWQTKRRNFRVNDIVLVRDEQAPRGKWPLARIIDTFPDKFGHVRSVRLQTATAERIRPIDKICLLEAAI